MNIVRSLSRVLLLGCLGLAACSSHSPRDGGPASSKHGDKADKPQLSEAELRLEADALYRRARNLLDSHDFTTAITDYDKLIDRYPFTDYGTQAELEKTYALYKSYQYDDAAAAADHFLRDHPRHPKADYVQYLKGLIEFDRDKSLMDLLPLDTSKADVTSDRLAFNDFALLVQKYPSSRYIADARLRMIYLRDRIARHEMSIVRFYMRRGAYIAAAKRCDEIIANYPGAPSTGEALQTLEEAYSRAGLTQEADSARKLLAGNPQVLHPVESTPTPRTQAAAATAPAAEAAPEPDALPAPAKTERHGFFGWFTGLFDRFDTSKPENTYTLVIPTGHDKATATDQAATNAGDKGQAAASPAGDAGQDTGQAAGSAEAKAAQPQAKGSHYLHVTVGPAPGDEWHPVDEAKPKAEAPATAGTSQSPAAPAAKTASESSPGTPEQAAPAAAEKPGFFHRMFTGIKHLFGFGGGSQDPAPDTKQPPATDAPAKQ